MYYYDPNNDKSNARRWASLAALLYALSIAAAFLFVSFDMGRDELLPGEGLLIDFGTTETGLGDRDLSATDVQAPPQQAAAEASRQQVEYVTSEREEIAVQTPQPEKKPRERETPGQPPQRSAAQQPAEHPRTEHRRALFPGRPAGRCCVKRRARCPVCTAGRSSTAEGPAAGEGNAGDLSGAPEGSHDGTGQSDSGIAYDLSGRSVVGKLPKPSYPGNESGKDVVDVTVDASGRVTYASYRAQGSTTNSKRLVDAAVEAARKARFSSSESLMQTGTITYVFTLN